MQLLPEVQEGGHGNRQQPAGPTEAERLQEEGEGTDSAKPITLPELVAKSPPPWPGLAEKKQPEPFYKGVSSGKGLPGVLHHQKKRQVSRLHTYLCTYVRTHLCVAMALHRWHCIVVLLLQIPPSKLHKPHHKATKPHFLLPLNHKNSHP